MFYPRKGPLVHTLHGIAELIKKVFQANGHLRNTAKGYCLLQAVMADPPLQQAAIKAVNGYIYIFVRIL